MQYRTSNVLYIVALQLVYVNLLPALERVLRAAADELKPVGDESSGAQSTVSELSDVAFVDEAELEEALACVLALMPYRAGREAVRGSQKMHRGARSQCLHTRSGYGERKMEVGEASLLFTNE